MFRCDFLKTLFHASLYLHSTFQEEKLLFIIQYIYWTAVIIDCSACQHFTLMNHEINPVDPNTFSPHSKKAVFKCSLRIVGVIWNFWNRLKWICVYGPKLVIYPALPKKWRFKFANMLQVKELFLSYLIYFPFQIFLKTLWSELGTLVNYIAQV